MSSSAALRVHTPGEVAAPLPAKVPGTLEQFESLFAHPEAKARIAPLLAPDDQYDRIVAVAMRAARKLPALLQCTPSSILDSAATIVGWNLEIGDTAFMVPYGKDCTPIMHYMGMIHILIAARVIRAAQGWCVYQNEADRGDFKLFAGSEARIYHVPMWEGADRGRMIGAYVNFDLPRNGSTFKWMPIDEIEAIRKAHSKQWYKDRNGNVIPCPPWYAIKCCIRQARKVLGSSPALSRAFASFERDGELAPVAEMRALASGEDMGSPADGQGLALMGNSAQKMQLEPTMALADAEAFIIPRGKAKGNRVDSLTPIQMQAALLWTVEEDEEPEFQLALATVLDAREKGAKQESEAKGAPAAATDASQDSPAGNTEERAFATSAPSAAPLAPGESYANDPYPEEDPAKMGTAALQAEVFRLLKHECMGKEFVAGTNAQIPSITHVELQKLVRQLRAMIAAAPPKRRRGERGAHSIGDLPGGV